jgi:hypothetical protein
VPKFAHLIAEVPCPGCAADLAVGGRIAFQWGYCEIPMHSSADSAVDAYLVGESIHWRAVRDGLVPAWAYFADGSGNIGDPAFRDVLVREWEIGLTQCRACHVPFEGIGVEIRGGVIREVRAFTNGLPNAEVSLILPDGSLVPQPDWDDHPMRVLPAGH